MTLPVPSQRTWSVGDIVTAAMMDANVRDAVNFLAQPPLFVGYQGTAQSIGANTWTAISLDSSRYDTYSGHSNTVNNSQYVIQAAGIYFMFGMVALATSATGSRYAAFYVGGSANTALPASSMNAASVPNEQYALGLINLSVGNYVELRTYTTAAVSTNVTPAGQQSMVGLWWVHS